MDNANVNQPETPTEPAVELTPELEAKLNEIKIKEESKPAPKGKKGLIAAVIVLLLVIACACVVVALNKSKNPNAGDNTPTPTSTASSASTIEDTTIKAKLDKQIETIHLVGKNNAGKNPLTVLYAYTDNDLLFKNQGFTDDEKLFIVIKKLHEIDNEFERVTAKDFSAAAIKELGDRVDSDTFVEYATRIKAETVAEKYEEIFGETVKHKTVDACGGAFYSEDTEYYYADVIGGCGGMDFREIQVLKTKYEETADTYTVDALVTSVYSGEKCYVFKGFQMLDDWDDKKDANDSRVYKTCTAKSDGSADFTLSEADAENVNTYRYTFDKDFHFKKIERL